SGGPSYPVFLGRRDGMKSDASWVDLPPPSISWEASLAYFTSKGLDVKDMVTLLGVDQQMLYGNDTHDLTDEFAEGLEDFRGRFAYSMSRMGGLKVLTGTKGQIRRNCHVVNK
nr:probable peroxidase 26 [Tanacetum cinerariifolium]